MVELNTSVKFFGCHVGVLKGREFTLLKDNGELQLLGKVEKSNIHSFEIRPQDEGAIPLVFYRDHSSLFTLNFPGDSSSEHTNISLMKGLHNVTKFRCYEHGGTNWLGALSGQDKNVYKIVTNNLSDEGSLVEVGHGTPVHDFDANSSYLGFLFDTGTLKVTREPGSTDTSKYVHFENARTFQFDGEKIGILQTDNTLVIRQFLNGPVITRIQGVAEFQMAGDSVLVKTANGELQHLKYCSCDGTGILKEIPMNLGEINSNKFKLSHRGNVGLITDSGELKYVSMNHGVKSDLTSSEWITILPKGAIDFGFNNGKFTGQANHKEKIAFLTEDSNIGIREVKEQLLGAKHFSLKSGSNEEKSGTISPRPQIRQRMIYAAAAADSFNATYLEKAGIDSISKFNFPASDNSIHRCYIGESNDGIVISFRGTAGTATDWANNVFSPLLSAPGVTGRVHAGFYTGAFLLVNQDEFREKLIELVIKRSLNGREEVLIYITGHSKGGALANIAAPLIMNIVATNTDRHAVPYVYTFAAPKPGDKVFADFYNRAVPNTYSYVYNNDIVPLLPPNANDLDTLVFAELWSQLIKLLPVLDCASEVLAKLTPSSAVSLILQFASFIMPLKDLLDIKDSKDEEKKQQVLQQVLLFYVIRIKTLENINSMDVDNARLGKGIKFIGTVLTFVSWDISDAEILIQLNRIEKIKLFDFSIGSTLDLFIIENITKNGFNFNRIQSALQSEFDSAWLRLKEQLDFYSVGKMQRLIKINPDISVLHDKHVSPIKFVIDIVTKTPDLVTKIFGLNPQAPGGVTDPLNALGEEFQYLAADHNIQNYLDEFGDK